MPFVKTSEHFQGLQMNLVRLVQIKQVMQSAIYMSPVDAPGRPVMQSGLHQSQKSLVSGQSKVHSTPASGLAGGWRPLRQRRRACPPWHLQRDTLTRCHSKTIATTSRIHRDVGGKTSPCTAPETGHSGCRKRRTATIDDLWREACKGHCLCECTHLQHHKCQISTHGFPHWLKKCRDSKTHDL